LRLIPDVKLIPPASNVCPSLFTFFIGAEPTAGLKNIATDGFKKYFIFPESLTKNPVYNLVTFLYTPSTGSGAPFVRITVPKSTPKSKSKFSAKRTTFGENAIKVFDKDSSSILPSTGKSS
jgi:hypothetical protein